VKTTAFRNPVYVGDPLNAIRIFNEKEVDELIFLDITATNENRSPRFEYIESIATECFMPLTYCGGVRTFGDIKKLLTLGVEKVGLNTAAIENPDVIRKATEAFGNQSIVVSIDVKKNLFGKHKVYSHGGTRARDIEPVAHAIKMQEFGAGEILLNSIDQDGVMQGYDTKLLKQVTGAVSIPVIACGGAGSIEHFVNAVNEGGASAVAAGSMFVFYGKHKAVLINYATQTELHEKLWSKVK
jgi:imidazole glycerol-phosphate synthase subunit HisF